MTQPSRPTGVRNKLVAVAMIALAAYFAAAVGVAAANMAQEPGRPPATAFTEAEPRIDEEIWEEEGWDENSEEGETEEAEEESEESSAAREECNLYSTTARLVTSDRSDSVHLTVRYEADEATNVTVEYWLKGTRGSFQLKALRRHMSTRGTIQGSERLSAPQMAKVRAARIFVIHLEMPGLPQYCERHCTRRLTARHQSGSRVTWSEPAFYTRPIR